MQTDDIAPFRPFVLSKGAHNGPKEGMCVMEMASWLAGEEWSDRPECVCPVIAAVCRMANDNMDQENRDRLQALLPMLMGTRDAASERARADIALEWMWTEVLPSLQDVADEGGFGSEWRAMCDDRTAKAAAAAVPAANASSVAAALAAAWAATATKATAATAAKATATAAGWAALANAAEAAEAAWPGFFEMLERMVEAGPHGDEYTEAHVKHAAQLRELVET